MELDIGLWGAFVAGFLSFISPCVLPLVPPYLCFLAGVSMDQLAAKGDQDQRVGGKVVRSSLAFVAGFSAVFVAFGASASLIGQVIIEYMEILTWFAGALIILLGLHLLGVFRVALFYREARIHVERKPPGLIGAFVVGLAFAFGWSPCVGPILAAILLVASTEDTLPQGAGLLLSYALGIGVPFILAAAFMTPFLSIMRRFRRYMGMVEKVTGGLLVLTGILFLTGGITMLSFWLLETFPSLGQVG